MVAGQQTAMDAAMAGKGDCAFSLTCVQDLNKAIEGIGQGIDMTTGPRVQKQRAISYLRDTFPVRVQQRIWNLLLTVAFMTSLMGSSESLVLTCTLLLSSLFVAGACNALNLHI